MKSLELIFPLLATFTPPFDSNSGTLSRIHGLSREELAEVATDYSEVLSSSNNIQTRLHLSKEDPGKR